VSRIFYDALRAYSGTLASALTKGLPPISSRETEYFVKYQVGGAVGIIVEWIENGMEEKSNELSDILQRITVPFQQSPFYLPYIIRQQRI